jgi:hypothetical protein
MHIIDLNNERALVHSLDGHGNATVVARDVPPPPSDYCTWDGAKWVEDTAAKNRAAELAKLNRMDRLEFLEECVRRSKLI